jgi:pimeloyl-ACP methyl ester carboxylesterase
VAAADLGNVAMRGPWKTAMKASTGPSGSSTLFYPMELGKDGVTHPVFHWGCGAGSQPSQYADHLNQLASQGIVVIANASGSMPGKASLDWILAENEKMGSMFYQKLDPKRVGTGGHSLGALETFQYAADPRLAGYVLVCGGTMSGTSKASDIHGPSIYLGGKGESGTTNFHANDWPATKGTSVFITHSTTDHIQCARDNLGPWVAFMRWTFCGEEQWKAEFMPGGTFCKSPWEACETKGF